MNSKDSSAAFVPPGVRQEFCRAQGILVQIVPMSFSGKATNCSVESDASSACLLAGQSLQ